MAIITISRGSYTDGKRIAEKLAERLQYKCISREDLIKASREFNISDIKLKEGIADATSILNRFSYGRERYFAYIQSSILKYMVQDNVIYHGMAGHTFVQGIDHELSVRIQADFEKRVKRLMDRDNISADKAKSMLKKDDKERQKWSLYVTRSDPYDSSNYDLIFNASRIPENEIIESIVRTVQSPAFQTTSKSQRKIEKYLIAAQVKAVLINDFPKSEITVKNDIINVNLLTTFSKKDEVTSEVNDILKKGGIKENVKLNVICPDPEMIKSRMIALLPDLEKSEISIDIDYRSDNNIWCLSFEKGRYKLLISLQEDEVENFLQGRESYHFDFRFSNLVKNFFDMISSPKE